MKRTSFRKPRFRTSQRSAHVRRGLILAGSIAALIAIRSAKGATLTFDSDGNGTNGVTEAGGTFTWTPGVSTNFYDGLTDVFTADNTTTDVARFGNGGGLQTLATVNVGTGSIAGLIFGANSASGGTSYLLTGTAPVTLTLGGSGIVANAGAAANTVGSANLSLSLAATQSWTNNSSRLLTVAGAVAMGGNTLTLAPAAGAGGITVSGVLSGTGGVAVNGAATGVATLSNAANSYSGPTTITSGILAVSTLANVGSNSGIGTGDNTDTASNAASLILNGGTLRYTGAVVSSDRLFTLTTSGGTIEASGSAALTLSNANAIVLSGTGTRALTLGGTSTAANTLNATLGDDGVNASALTKIGTGAWTLGNATHTYTGTTMVSGGTLTVSGASGSIANSTAIVLNGGKLVLDNTTLNTDRVGTVPVTLSLGGELSITNHASSATTESIGELKIDNGAAIVTSSGAAGGVLENLTAASFSRVNNATALIRGTSLGQTATNATRLTLTDSSGLTLVGTTAAAGVGTTTNLKIVPYLLGDTSATGAGTGFMTYDSVNGLRPLASAEYIPAFAAAAADDNSRPTGSSTTLTSKTLNSLIIGAFAGAQSLSATAAGNTVTLTSGALAQNSTSLSTMGGWDSITFGNGEGVISVLGSGGLALNSPLAVTLSGGITKSGTGVLTIGSTATYTGSTNINQGTLQFAATTGDIASSSDIKLNGGTLNVTRTNGITIGQNITGTATTGGLTQNATGGTTILSGTNTYSSPTTITAGTLQFQGAGGLSPNTALSMAGATLQIRHDGAGNNGTINLGNSLTVTATGATIDVANNGGANTGNTVAFGPLSLTAQNTTNFTGANGYNVSFSGLTLVPGTGQTTVLNPTTTSVIIAGNVTNPMSGFGTSNFDTLTLDGTSTGNAIQGNISDATGGAFAPTLLGGYTRLIKQNTSTWTLSGTGNSYTGFTQVLNGTLRAGANDVIPLNNVQGINVNATGAGATATFDLGTFNQTFSNTTTAITLAGTTATSTPQITGSGTSTITLAGTGGGVTYTSTNNPLGASIGVATLDLGGAVRTFNVGNSTSATDDLTISSIIQNGGLTTATGTGQLKLSGVNTFSGGVTIGAGSVSVSSIGIVGANGNLGNNGIINLGSSTAAGALVYTGTGETTDRVINLNGAATFGATLDQSGTGNLKFSSDLTVAAGAKTLTLQGSTAGTGEIGGKIVDGTGPTATSLLKLGTGTWTISNANTYTGTTTVQNGTLKSGISETIGSANTQGINVNATGAGVTAAFDLATFDQTFLNTPTAITLQGSTATSTPQVTGSGSSTITISGTGGGITYTSTNNPKGGTISATNLDLGAATRTFSVGNSTSAGADLTVSSSITNGTIAKTGAGALVQTAAYTLPASGTSLSLATNTGSWIMTNSVTSSVPQTVNNASAPVSATNPNGGIIDFAGKLDLGSNLLTVQGAGSTRLANTATGAGANNLNGGVTINGGHLVVYAPAAGAVGAGSGSSLTSSGGAVTPLLNGTNPVLHLAPNLGTSLTNGTTAGLLAKGYSGQTTLAGNNFLSNSVAIATMTGNFTYLNVPVGGATIANVPSNFAAAAGFTATTSYQITGLLNITTAGVYKFAANVDDFQSLVVDGIAPLASSNVATTYGELYLSSGLHVLNYRAGNNGTNGTIGLAYAGPDQPSLASIPASALFQANNAADLATTFSTGATIAAGTSATIDIPVNTTMGTVAMSGTGAGTVLNVTGSGNLNRLTINGLTLTDSLTVGQAAVNPTALITLAGTIDNTSANPVTLTLSNTTNNATDTNPNRVTGNITESGGGALTLTKSTASTWVSSGASTYTGGTNINSGILQVQGTETPGVSGPLGKSGPITFGGGTLQYSSTNSADYSSRFAANSAVLVDTNGQSVSFASNIGNGGTSALTKSGAGTLTLAGTNTYTGNTTISNGTLNVTGTITGNTTASTLAYGNSATTTIVNVSNNMTMFATAGANIAGSVAVYNQTAGTVTVSPGTGNSQYVVKTGYGYFNLTGGTYKNTNRFDVSGTSNQAANAAVGVVFVGGTGFLDHTNGDWFINGYNTNSVTVGTGGAIDHTGSSNPFTVFMDSTVSGGTYGVLNIAGGTVTTGAQPLRFGNSTTAGTNNTGFVNLASGTLSTGSNISLSVNTGNNAYFNFAGGTLKATAALSNFIPATASGITLTSTLFGAIDNAGSASDFAGGLTVDTNGNAVTIGNPLKAATGSGVYSSNLSITGGSGYVGAPFVQFSGGTVVPGGTPASGYAVISGGAVTGIVITSPGTYSVAPTTVSLLGGGGTGASVSVSGLTANVSGGLTKTGPGTLTLTGANTFTGPLVVNSGQLVIGAGGSITGSSLSGRLGRSMLTSAGGALSADTAADYADINRTASGIGTGAVGITAATAASAIDLSSAGLNLPTMGLGAIGSLTYTGTFTPGTSGVYRLGGGSGVLTFNGAGGITGTSSVAIAGGTVALTGTNNFTGAFTLATGATLQVNSANVAANFGTAQGGLVSSGGTIQWASALDITSGVAAIGNSGTSGTSLGFSAGTTILDTGSNNVTLAGTIGYGNGAISKLGSGTLTLTGATNLAYPFTGTTTIPAGAGGIVLGNATALRTSSITNTVAGTGLTFSPGIGTFTIGGLVGATTTGNITLLDTGSTAVTLQVGQNNANTTYSGVLSGALGALTKIGVGTLTINTNPQTYTGATTITGGTSNTNLGNSGLGVGTSTLAGTFTAASTNLYAQTSQLTFGSNSTSNLNPGGGTFSLTGSAAAVTNTQTFNNTLVAGGFSGITIANFATSPTANLITLSLGNLTRSGVTVTGAGANASPTGGGTINFQVNTTGGNAITTNATILNDATGILGAWATIGGTNYASTAASGTNLPIIPYTGYSDATATAANLSTGATNLINKRINITGGTATTSTTTNAATTDLNTLAVAAATVNNHTLTMGTAGTNTNTFLRLGNSTGVGGILYALGAGTTTVSAGALTIGNVANNGVLTAGTATVSELDIYNGIATGIAGNGITINSAIKDNGLGVGLTLVKSGAGSLALAGTNTYTGGTILQAGRVNAAANTSAFGTGVVTVQPGAQVLITGGTFTNNFNIAGSGLSDSASNLGAIRMDTGVTISGNVTLIGDAVIGSTAATNVTGGTISGNISGPFSLYKSGSNSTGQNQGRIILSGTNTYTGATVVQIGVLQFGAGTTSTGSYSGLAANSVFVGGFPGATAPTAGNTVYVNTTNAGDFQSFLNTKANPASTGSFAMSAAEAASNISFATAGLSNAYLAAGASLTYTGTFTPGSVGRYQFGGGDTGAVLTFQPNIADVSSSQRSSVTIGQANGLFTLTGTNTYTGGFAVSGSTYQLSAALASQFGTAASGVAGVSITGGTIQWKSGVTVDLSGVTGGLSIGGGTLDTNGNSVTLATPFLQTGGLLTKAGGSTLTLGAVAPIYGWTGGITINGGTNNTTPSVVLNTATSIYPSATLTVNNNSNYMVRLGTSLTVGNLIMGSTTSPVSPVTDLNGNTLTTGLGNGPGSVIGSIVSQANPTSAGLIKIGAGTMTYYPRAASTFSNTLQINGGLISIDFSNAATTINTNPFSTSVPLTLGGGGFSATGRASTTNSQAFASTTLNPGASAVNISANNSTANPLSVDLKALTRNVGGTLDIVNPANGTLGASNGVNTAALNTDFSGTGGQQTIIGGYATVAGTNWAVTANSGTSNFVTALASYNAGFAAGKDVDAAQGASAPGALAINSLRFNAAGVGGVGAAVDAAGGLTVASGGILVTSSVGAANSVTFNNGTLATGNTTDLIVINNNGTAATGAVIINSQITGGSGIALTKSGGGYLVLGNASNDYGKTYLNGGVLQVSAAGQLGAGDITIGSNSTNVETRLEFTTAGVTANNNIIVNSAHPTAGFGSLHYNGAAGGSVTLGGTISFNLNSTAGGQIGSGQATGGFNITGAINAPYGVQVVFRNGINTVSGGGTYYSSQIAQDTLKLGANNGVSTSAVLNVAGSAVASFDLAGFNQSIEGLIQTGNFLATIANSGATGPKTLTLTPGANESYTFGAQGAGATIGQNVVIAKTGAGTQTIGAQFVSNSAISVSQGTLVITGSNLHTGGTTVAGGTLKVGGGTALGGVTGFDGTVTVNSGTLDLNGIANVAVGNFSGLGGTVTDSSVGAATTVFSTASNTSSAFAGVINDGSFGKALAFYKDGTGILTLSGASNYSGVTNIFKGALNIQNATALGSVASGTNVSSGAALEIQGPATVVGAEALTLNGTGTGAATGALRNVSGTNTYGGAITLGSASRINSDFGTLTLSNSVTSASFLPTFGGAGDTIVTGALTLGSTGLAKDGAGTLSLQNGNSYSGATVVSNGTLNIRHATALGTADGSAGTGTTLASGAVLQVQGGIAVGNEALVTPVLQSVSGTNSWAGNIQAANGSGLTLQSDLGTLTVDGAVNAQSADTTNQALVLTGAGDGVVSNLISNPSLVTKSGGGTWQFTGGQSYAANTNVNAGTLKAGSANSFSANSNVVLANVTGTALDLNGANQTIKSLAGGGASGGNVTLGAGQLTMGTTSDTVYSGAISGTGAVLKQGAGSFALGSTGSINTVGGIQINVGSFYVNGTTSGTTPITVAGLATLGGAGNAAGAVTVNSTGIIEAGQFGDGQLATGGLTFGAGSGDLATVNLFDIGLGGAASIINVTGNLIALGGANTVTINATNTGALNNGSYDLITYTGTLSGFSAFKPGTITGLSGRQAGVITDVPGVKLYLSVTGDAPKWTGYNTSASAVSASWRLTPAITNWKLITGGGATDYRANDSVLFDDSVLTAAPGPGSGSTTADIDSGNVAPASVTFSNNTVTYTVQSTGGYSITGGTGILKNGTGLVNLNNSNSFTGGLVINGGTLALNAANTFTGDVAINSGGILKLGAAGALGTGNAVSFGPGASSSTKFQLNGNNATVTSLTTDAVPGTPIVENSHASAPSVLTVNLTAGTQTFAGLLQDGAAGTLGLTKDGAGTLILTAANSLTGGNTVTAGTLQVGSGGTSGGLTGDTSVASGAQLLFSRSDTSSYTGAISGAGAVEVSGGGTFTLSGGSTGTHSLAAQGGGTLILTGNSAHTGGTTIAANTTLQIGNGGATGALSGAGTAAVNGALVYLRDNSVPSTIQANLTGAGPLSVNTGTLVLAGSNSGFSGTETIANGASLQVGAGGTAGTLGAAPSLANNGTLIFSRSDAITVGTNVTGSGALNARMIGSGSATLTGTNSYSAGTFVQSGTLILGSATAFPANTAVTVGSIGGTGIFDLNGRNISVNSLAHAGVAGDQTITNGSNTTAILTYNSAGASTFGGSIADGSAIKKIGVTITGGGTLRLAKANSYTGGTSVSNGTAQLGADDAFGSPLTLGGAGTAGILDLNGFNQTISSFAVGAGGTPASQIFGNSSTTSNSVLTYSGGTLTFASTIQDVLGSGNKTTGLNLAGSGTFIVTSNNTYSGTTVVGSGATLQLGAGGIVGNIGTGPISNSGSLVFNRSTAYTLDAGNIVTGVGPVTLASAASVVTSTDGQFNTTGVLNLGSTTGATIVTNLNLGNGSSTFGSLIVRTNSSSANTISIGLNKTLLFTGAVTVGYSSGAATTTKLAASGLGTLSFGTLAAPTNTGVTIGANVTDVFSNGATLDLSSLSNFYANLGSGIFRIGDPANSTGTATLGSTLILAASSTITAATLVADSPDSSVTEAIKLGSGTNRLNLATLNVGAQNGRSSGTFGFNTGAGTLTIRGLAGGAAVPDNTSRANLNVVNNVFSTGATPSGTFDTTGHSADLLFGTMTIAGRSANTGTATGVFNFDTGTLDANDLIVGNKTSGSTATTEIGGTVSLSGGNSTFNALSNPVLLGVNASTATGATAIARGTLNISGNASVTVAANGGNSIRLGDASAAGGRATGIIGITGGTLTVAGDIVRGASTGTSLATLTLDGGTLDLGGNRIGGSLVASNLTTVTLASGTLKNVAGINNGAGLTKTAGGGSNTLMLTKSGILENTYTGDTIVSAGTLSLGASQVIPDGAGKGNVSVAGVLDLNTFSETINGLSGAGVVDTVAGGTPTLTLGGNDQSASFSGAIQNTAGTLAVTKVGGGTQILAGNNPYTGPTRVSGGVLEISGKISGTVGTGVTVETGGTLRLNSTSNLHNIIGTVTGTDASNYVGSTAYTGLTGSTLAVANTSVTNTFTTLTLSGTSTLDFGSGNTNNTFVFASLTGSVGGMTGSAYGLFTGTTTLNITNWNGAVYAPDATDDLGSLGDSQSRLLFNSDPGFGSGPIAGFNFVGLGAGMQVKFGANQWEIVPVPEPSSLALCTAASLLGLAGYRRRRS